MKILFLENRGSVSHYMEMLLEKEGHTVLSALDVSDAIGHWQENEDIECLIVDLNVPPRGLNEAQQKDSKSGLLAGWIWLRDYVLKEKPEMYEQIIIYTDYLDELKAFTSEDELKGIYLVRKRPGSSPAEEVLAHVKVISRHIEGKKK